MPDSLIHKEILSEHDQTIQMPVGAKVLSVINQREAVALYYQFINGETVVAPRRFEVMYTGAPFEDQERTFIGTVSTHNGAMILHVFETPIK